MSKFNASKTTSNIGLSQFEANDTPKWLQDYNDDMDRIDQHAGKVASESQYGHYKWGDDATKFNNPTGTSTQLLNGQGMPITPTATPTNGSTLPFTAGGAYAELAKKLDRTQVQDATGSSTSDPISQNAATAAIKEKLHANNLIYAGNEIITINMMNFPNGLYFVTKLHGGSGITIGSYSRPCFVVTKNGDYMFVYSLDGTWEYFNGAIGISVTAGNFYVFGLQNW